MSTEEERPTPQNPSIQPSHQTPASVGRLSKTTGRPGHPHAPRQSHQHHRISSLVCPNPSLLIVKDILNLENRLASTQIPKEGWITLSFPCASALPTNTITAARTIDGQFSILVLNFSRCWWCSCVGSLHSHGKSAARSTAWLGRDLVESEAKSLGCDCERHCLDVAGIEQNNYQYQEG